MSIKRKRSGPSPEDPIPCMRCHELTGHATTCKHFKVEVGQVWLSRDHRNQHCPYLRVETISVSQQPRTKGVEFAATQRYKDRELTQPVGKPVPIQPYTFGQYELLNG